MRPRCCPCCGNPSTPHGRALGVVGHGTYSRQVCGVVPGENIVIEVRRFLCKACKRTFSVLPPDLIRGRWYSAAAILVVLVGHLLLASSAAALAEAHGPTVVAERWRTPQRWAAQLGAPLWSHRAREVGDRPDLPRATLLARLLGLAGTHARGPTDELHAAARLLTVAPASRRSHAR